VLAKNEGKVAPAFVVAFFEKRLAVGGGVKTPAEAVAEPNVVVSSGCFFAERGELMGRVDGDLAVEEETGGGGRLGACCGGAR